MTENYRFLAFLGQLVPEMVNKCQLLTVRVKISRYKYNHRKDHEKLLIYRWEKKLQIRFVLE